MTKYLRWASRVASTTLVTRFFRLRFGSPRRVRTLGIGFAVPNNRVELHGFWSQPISRPPAGLTVCTAALFVVLTLVARVSAQSPDNDIRRLSQHFLTTDNRTAPWIFAPRSNIASLSTSEHPGVVTIWEAGRGHDVKGLLERPIRIEEYPLPWEFHLGLIQNYQAMKGISERQINYAIGLNLVVTFSPPATWPKDRFARPRESHEMELFLVHLGNVGENYRPGVPQVKETPLNQFDPSPEVYLVAGRGDLAPQINGNWKMNYTWLGGEGALSGSTAKIGGPAHSIVRFRVNMLGPTSLQVGVGFGPDAGYRLRTIDVSRFGKITGIWEIGPIFSLDRWVPDELAKELRVAAPPAYLKSLQERHRVVGATSPAEADALKKIEQTFRIDAPDPKFEYFVDYALFHGNGPDNLDHLSDEFNVPGFLADEKWSIEGNGLAETYSHPGSLTVTLLGMNGAWAMCPNISGDGFDLLRQKLPLNFETAFTAPGDERPWNLWWTFNLVDSAGKNLGQGWNPGVQNIPGKGRRFINSFAADPSRFATSRLMNVEFEKDLPQSLLAARPVHMLVQVMDSRRIRIGFKARAADPWLFSRTFDVEASLGKPIGKIGYPCLASFQGSAAQKGWGVGNSPGYQQFLFDYVRFRGGR